MTTKIKPWVQPDRPTGPIEPLPLPDGATPLEHPIRIKTAGWVKMKVDAYMEVDGIIWARVLGGFGDGQQIGWHPREDWIAVVPGLSLSVGRYFSAPYAWKGDHAAAATIEQAMRAEVRCKLDSARYRVRKESRQLEQTVRGMAILAGSLR